MYYATSHPQSCRIIAPCPSQFDPVGQEKLFSSMKQNFSDFNSFAILLHHLLWGLFG